MKKGDIWLIGILLLVGGALLAYFSLHVHAAAEVRIYEEGALIESLPLSVDADFLWQDGNDFLRLEIRGGTARVAESSCPDQYCVRRGAIATAGDALICLPNRITAALEGEAGKDLDAVLY